MSLEGTEMYYDLTTHNDKTLFISNHLTVSRTISATCNSRNGSRERRGKIRARRGRSKCSTWFGCFSCIANINQSNRFAKLAHRVPKFVTSSIQLINDQIAIAAMLTEFQIYRNIFPEYLIYQITYLNDDYGEHKSRLGHAACNEHEDAREYFSGEKNCLKKYVNQTFLDHIRAPAKRF